MLQYITLFGLNFVSYSLCAVVGFCVALAFAFFRNRRNRIEDSAYYLFIFFAAIGMFVGSRLMFFISMIPTMIENDYTVHDALMVLINGGFVFYGGLLGALAGGVVCAKISRIRLKELLNVFLPPMVVFHIFGRIGCFMAGCCYGIESPIGFSFPYEEVTRLPVPLMEAAYELIIVVVLVYKDSKTQGKTDLTLLYLMMYAPMRFVLEYLRGDDIRGHWGLLSTSQWLSIFIVIVVVLCVYIQHRKNKARKDALQEV